MGKTSGLLTEQSQQFIHDVYQRCRQRGATRITALLIGLLMILAWLFLPLESASWQKVRQQYQHYFPHLAKKRIDFLDGLRYLIQTLWLLLIRSPQSPVYNVNAPQKKRTSQIKKAINRWIAYLGLGLNRLVTKGKSRQLTTYLLKERYLLPLMAVLAVIFSLLCVTQPFSLMAQMVFLLLLWLVGWVLYKIPGRVSSLMLIVLSLIISCRYLWWRYTSTLNWHDPVSLICGLLLLAAETYAWLVLILGYFQTIWPLHRQPAPLPDAISEWPTVDIMIPSYNEPLSVIQPTVYAALRIDWPKDKLNIYLLDDGDRPHLKSFAERIGIHYIARPTHEHAKAGNINNALRHSNGKLIAIFDCDHVPTRTFLQLTVGWFFKDPKLAVVQTPHHFFSPDPFERNLGYFRQMPNEGTLFYGLVQNGNDMWDASFFCGSCAVISRSALEEIGGIAVETVTEDAHTSLKLHRLGYTSAYIPIPLAAGLATESLSAHLGQRIRWARGMIQIFRLDNPLFGKGLKWMQRLCYFNAMLHFLSGIPRLIFLLAPLAFLLLNAYVIYAPVLAILLYVLPHILHANLANSHTQGKYRASFWSEVYETVLAWYIARPTTIALINPRAGKFNVTAKGGIIEQEHIDWKISPPYLVLIGANFLGLIIGIWRLISGPSLEIPIVSLNLLWVLYNMVILGAVLSVLIESKQIRLSHRVQTHIPAVIGLASGHYYPVTLKDYSDSGVAVELAAPFANLQQNAPISLLLKRGEQEFDFPCVVVYSSQKKLGLRLDNLTTEQQMDFIQCTFARADTWAVWHTSFTQEKPLRSLVAVLMVGLAGYRRILAYLPSPLRTTLMRLNLPIRWLGSFLPRNVSQYP